MEDSGGSFLSMSFDGGCTKFVVVSDREASGSMLDRGLALAMVLAAGDSEW